MKEKINRLVQRSRDSYKSLPDKKQYVEFFTAVLSVPVLLTVILLNVNNLRNTNKSVVTSPVPTQEPVREVIYISPKDNHQDSSNTIAIKNPTSEPQTCDSSLGPIDIPSPQEGASLSDNPVSVIVHYPKGKYCAVVWAYRINNGRWSEYDDKSIALYNLPTGQIVLDLKVKSIVTGEEKLVSRSFSYVGNGTNSTTASASAN